MVKILEFITVLRESFAGSEYVYQNGSCYQLYKILSLIFSGARPYYSESHIVTRIGDKFYDITGEVDGLCYVPYKPEHGCNKKFSLWANGWECPACDEITAYSDLCAKQVVQIKK